MLQFVYRAGQAASIAAKLRKIADKTPTIVGDALFEEGEIEMGEMKERTPVEFGALRASGTVHPPEYQGKRIIVHLSFGGVSAPYAIYVHEDLEAFHPIGQAKFAESVMNESEAYMPMRVYRRIQQGIGRIQL